MADPPWMTRSAAMLLANHDDMDDDAKRRAGLLPPVQDRIAHRYQLLMCVHHSGHRGAQPPVREHEGEQGPKETA